MKTLSESPCPVNAAGHCPHADDGGPCHYCQEDIGRAAKHLLADMDRPDMHHVHVWSKSGPLSRVYSCECGVVDASATGTRPS